MTDDADPGVSMTIARIDDDSRDSRRIHENRLTIRLISGSMGGDLYVRPGRQAETARRGEPGRGGVDGPGRRRAAAAAIAADRRRRGRRGRCSSPAARGASGRRTWSLNLAIALGELGQRVVLVDADLGLANLDLLCGLAPAIRPGRRAGGRLPAGRRDRDGPGRHPDRARARTRSGRWSEVLGDGPARLVAELAELEAEADFVLVDAGSGLGPGDRDAGRGGRRGGDRHDARADLDRRRARGDRPVPPAGRPAPAPGRWSTRPPRPPRRPTSSTGWSPRAGSSSGAVVSPLGPARPGRPPRAAGGPRPSAVPDGVSQARSPRAASDGWPAP